MVMPKTASLPSRVNYQGDEIRTDKSEILLRIVGNLFLCQWHDAVQFRVKLRVNQFKQLLGIG